MWLYSVHDASILQLRMSCVYYVPIVFVKITACKICTGLEGNFHFSSIKTTINSYVSALDEFHLSEVNLRVD